MALFKHPEQEKKIAKPKICNVVLVELHMRFHNLNILRYYNFFHEYIIRTDVYE